MLWLRMAIFFAVAAPVWQCASTTPADDPNSGETDCFSPEQNLDTAYEDDAYGCACTDEKDTCRPDSDGRLVALVCDEALGQWTAVEDGPCKP